ncbi:MAG: LPS export ABC transporter periplasmic protein LptC [Sphingomonadaceae bacterium]|nr:LPS export ABC transporter periplasmic protein LptC [Sphingomonadaceae bacterium]
MSEAALAQRTRRRAWAAPGSRHDRLVRILAIALPLAIGVLAAFLFMAPLNRDSELAFHLDKDSLEQAGERMRIENARYSGADTDGHLFQLRAGSAVQPNSREPLIRLNDLSAMIDLSDGAASFAAERGLYNSDTQMVAIDGPVALRGSDGYALDTSDVVVDLNSQRMRSRGGVEGRIPLGSFSAERMSVDIEDRRVSLEGRARLRIVQGGGR